MASSKTVKVVPLLDLRAHRVVSPPLEMARADGPPTGRLLDARHRPLRDLRISVTDRCNFRGSYCMPKGVFGKDYP